MNKNCLSLFIWSEKEGLLSCHDLHKLARSFLLEMRGIGNATYFWKQEGQDTQSGRRNCILLAMNSCCFLSRCWNSFAAFLIWNLIEYTRRWKTIIVYTCTEPCIILIQIHVGILCEPWNMAPRELDLSVHLYINLLKFLKCKKTPMFSFTAQARN